MLCFGFSQNFQSDTRISFISNHITCSRHHNVWFEPWFLDCMLLSCHVRVSKWIYSIVCMNVRELLAQCRRHVWSSSDSNEIRTHNHLVPKRTLNHLAKLAKWWSCAVSTYLYDAFVCMLSRYVQVSEWIHTE